ncbi:M23 family metallopeptidase [Lactiplantibacillus plantarum]|uniref:M23 family metallopeptidase n=1 Tax=Lactiplantibacillus plantarum TaxID=1590 RepID=UPI00093041BA|nr:M23 family metallopeptidase [Lactiplantibacillus plantarum]MDN7044335.1 M23 family metallopeptidase [Lactiplantibacillus plantarum]
MKNKWLALLFTLTTTLGLVFLGTTLKASANSVVRVTSDSATVYSGVDGTATRTLPINSAWQYDQRVQGNGGAWWYRVSTNEWVKDTNVSESTQSAKNATGVVTVKNGKTATVRASLNGRAVGQTLASGTGWKYSQVAVDAWNFTWYHVSSTGWVSSTDVTDNNSTKTGWPFARAYNGQYENGQQFGPNTGTGRPNGFHDGFDFGSAIYGNSVFKSITNGRVIYAQYYDSVLKDVIVVQAPDGKQIMYQEFSSRGDNMYVHTGDTVTVGQSLGYMSDSHLHVGVTGMNWQSALHYAFTNNGTWINPITYIQNNLN